MKFNWMCFPSVLTLTNLLKGDTLTTLHVILLVHPSRPPLPSAACS